MIYLDKNSTKFLKLAQNTHEFLVPVKVQTVNNITRRALSGIKFIVILGKNTQIF